jgi:hypothetical protein
MHVLKLLTCGKLLHAIVLSYGRARYDEREHDPTGRRENSISHGLQPLLKASTQSRLRL